VNVYIVIQSVPETPAAKHKIYCTLSTTRTQKTRFETGNECYCLTMPFNLCLKIVPMKFEYQIMIFPNDVTWTCIVWIM